MFSFFMKLLFTLCTYSYCTFLVNFIIDVLRVSSVKGKLFRKKILHFLHFVRSIKMRKCSFFAKFGFYLFRKNLISFFCAKYCCSYNTFCIVFAFFSLNSFLRKNMKFRIFCIFRSLETLLP